MPVSMNIGFAIKSMIIQLASALVIWNPSQKSVSSRLEDDWMYF